MVTQEKSLKIQRRRNRFETHHNRHGDNGRSSLYDLVVKGFHKTKKIKPKVKSATE